MRKYNVIDLFCGCGGLSEGFKLSGFNIVGGIDFNKSAIDTYNFNFGQGKGICCDLLSMDKEDIDIHTHNGILIIKRNEIMSFAATWMRLSH